MQRSRAKPSTLRTDTPSSHHRSPSPILLGGLAQCNSVCRPSHQAGKDEICRLGEPCPRVLLVLHPVLPSLLAWSQPLLSTGDHPVQRLDLLARTTSELVAANALLRKPLLLLNRQVKRPAFTRADRLLLVLLAPSLTVPTSIIHAAQLAFDQLTTEDSIARQPFQSTGGSRLLFASCRSVGRPERLGHLAG
jgi:hypothetical protein